jgi:hypothetical protein
MDHSQDDGGQLARSTTRALAGTARFSAPDDLEAVVLQRLDRRAAAPWWWRRVPEWPLPAQGLFALTGAAIAAALLLGRLATPRTVDALMSQSASVLQQPVVDLRTTLNLLLVFDRLTDTIAGSLPDGVWYGGIALCAAAYVALFFLVVFGYRLLRAPLTSR